MNLNITILGQAISFIFFVIFCMKYIWPPLINAIEKRQKYIVDSLNSIEQAKKDIEISRIKANDYLYKAKIESKNIIDQAFKFRTDLINKAKSEAKKESSLILNRTKDEINIELKRISEDLRKQYSTLIILGIEKIIGQSISNDINQDLINKTVNEIYNIKDINLK